MISRNTLVPPNNITRKVIKSAQSPRYSRRQILTTGIGALLAGNTIGFTPRIAYAQDPLTVLTVAQTAFSAARLLFGGGPSLVDLINLQTEMLREISQQIAIVQQGIIEILNRLDQLTDMIQNLPRDTVMELCRTRIAGLNSRYAEVLQSYDTFRSASGIAYARANTVTELTNEVLVPLREARDDLMTYHEYILTPIVCTACFTETHLMIMTDELPGRAQAAFDRYAAWFNSIKGDDTSGTDTLTGAISTARTQLLAIRSAINSAPAFNGTCLGDYQVLSWSNGETCGNPTWPVCTFAKTRTVQLGEAESRLGDEQFKAAVDAMVSAGVLPADEIPSQVNITRQISGDTTKFVVGPPSRLGLPTCDSIGVGEFDGKLANSPQIAHLTLKLMSLRALNSAAAQGSDFISQFRQRFAGQ